MTHRFRILLIDDEPEFADFLRRGLTYEGYSVGVAHSADAGWRSIKANRPDLLLLDVMLPDFDGIALCQQLRQVGQAMPILMLTARDAVSDRVAGLNAGADGYLPKPFAFDELLARLRALLRRLPEKEIVNYITLGEATLLLDQRKIRRGDRTYSLSAKEFGVLELLFRHPNQVFTRAELLDQVWGYDSDVESNVVDVYMHVLRTKLGDPNFIDTIRHVGYVLREVK